MGIPDHLTCLLRNLYADQEATVRTGHETTDWFKIGKGHVKAVYCHPALTSMQHMEFRKMVTMTLYVRQQKRHRYKDRLLDSGRRREWDDLRE